MQTFRNLCLLGFGATLAIASASPSFAAPNLITNGNFESTTATSSQQLTTTNLTGWSSTGYNFVFLPGAGTSGSTADVSGASGNAGNVKLWGPGDGSNNGFTNSPVGGNFIAADDNYQQGAITQAVGGLTVGQAYYLSFLWAGAQQQGFDGTTQEQWTVGFGNQTQATSTINLASHAFSGWQAVTFTFVATAAQQTLSFLATGSPGGAPPFSLLDGVSLTAVPEPGTWALLATGVFGLGFLSWSRRRNNATRSGTVA